MYLLTRRNARRASRIPVRPRLEALEQRLAPAVLTVGPGETYALPSQAAAAAHDGDTIDISSAGNYNGDTCLWTQNNLTIQGVGGGRAHIDITGKTAYGDKAVWVIDGSDTTVNNIELSGAHDTLNTGHNWAGIRLEGNTLTLNNDYFHNDDDGILTDATNANLGPTSNIVINGSEFADNGYGDGQSHNMYIGQVTSFTLENSYSHDANEGHLVKSRALFNYILYNRLEDGSAATSTASYELDLPQGGTSYVIGNLIEQGPHSANHTIIAYAEEGARNPGESLYLVNNTIVNDYSGGTFVNVPTAGTSALLENNIFCGPGTVAAGSGSVTQTTNLVSNNPGFVNQAGYDYHLVAGSAAIDAGTAPGTVNKFNLTPMYEYVDPLSLQSRPVDGKPLDIGAYEYAGSGSGPSTATTTANSATAVFSTRTQNVTLTADVTSRGGPVNEGTVTFTILNGVTPLVSIQGPVSGGEASANITLPAGLTAGSYGLAVHYSDGRGNFVDGGDSNAALSVGAAATTVSLTQASLTPDYGSLTDTETLTAHVSSSTAVMEGTVTFYLSNMAVTANVDGNGDATAVVTLSMLDLFSPQSISIGYSDAAGNLAGSSNGQSAQWQFINALLPSTATFSPNSEAVTADLFGLFITYTNGLLTEIVYGSIEFIIPRET